MIPDSLTHLNSDWLVASNSHGPSEQTGARSMRVSVEHSVRATGSKSDISIEPWSSIEISVRIEKNKDTPETPNTPLDVDDV